METFNLFGSEYTCIKNFAYSSEMNCSDPPVIANGACTPVPDTLLKASCPFVCDSGYDLNGHDTSFCAVVSGSSAAAWNGTAPTCNSK